MDWCRLSTSYYHDGAVLRAGEAAEVLFLRCIAYSGAQETRGRVPKRVLPMLSPTRTSARLKALLAEDLLVDDGQDVLIRSWDRWQEALDSESERRRKDRERKRADREAAKSEDTSVDSSEDIPRTVQAKSARIEVEVEEEKSSTRTSAARKHAISPDWRPSQADLDWAKTEAPLVNVERETASFVDYWLDRGVKRGNWSLTWRPRMRMRQEELEARPALRAVGARSSQYDWDV